MSLEDPTSALRITPNKLKQPFKVKLLLMFLLFLWLYPLSVFLLRVNRETADKAAGPDLASL